MDPFSQYFTRMREAFSSFSPMQKASMAIAAFLTVLTILFLVFYAGQREYGLLYSNLSSEDAANIVTRLKERNIPYQLSAAGDTIRIPTDQIAEMRLELASAGLPQGGGAGFEIFDKQAIGATEFEQQLNYRRALQGELARTINSIDEVQSSRVHIALPRESLFVETQKKATASVTLRLKPGRNLRPPQIEGIAHLVASSIEGMSPDEVVIVDSGGNILSKIYDDSRLAKLTLSQSEYQRNIETTLARNIQTLLENVVGPGKAVARVAADINFKVTEKTEETFDAENPSVRSMQKQSERSSAPVASAKAASPGAENLSEKEKINEILNYELNRVTSKTILPTGDIQKLSVAVLVDGRYKKNEKGVEEYQPLERKELEALEQLVIKSAGINVGRGDQVTVTNMPFKKMPLDGELLPVDVAWHEKMPQYYPLIRYALVFFSLLFVGLFLIRPLIRAATHKRPEAPGPVGQLAAPVSVEISQRAKALAGAPGISFMGDADKEMTEIDVIKKMASADAKKFAELLRAWLK